ncbi:type I secretion system permease/ATPase [Paracoccus benzoatiresistens]|uniref:ATP-binding cassette domain-containing protein n=1 Tax=Paracoccus benzoatiresistens TaxID=2997341 RepID=A0ABT4J0Q3_9RHOB|nr:ATP-binding cassette domain-containing protein [Paracoccus sp. EF6]MCZ0960677.1 ATP-binding cassette domain-containing protein [Paracoccus sp. EF6]
MAIRARRKPGTGTVIRAAWAVSRPGLFAAFLFTTVFNVLKFALPLYLLQVLDRVPSSRSIETLVMLTIAVLIAVFCGMLLDIIRRRMFVRWGNWIEAQLAPRILHQGLAEARSERNEDDTSRGLDDVARLRTFVAETLASWMDVVFAPLFFLGVFLIHPTLGWVALGALVPLFLVSVAADQMTRDQRRAVGDAGREAGSILTSAEVNRESVGGLAMANTLAERWRGVAESRAGERNTAQGRDVTFRAILRTLSQLLRIAMIAVGVWLYVQGSLTLGGIFAARILAGFGFTLAEKALARWRNLREALASYRSIRKRLTITQTSSISVLPNLEADDIILDGVTFRYPNERRDLYRRLSLRFGPGQMLLISGSAGVGKSTLARLLVGTLKPRDGQVRIGDMEICRLPPELRSRMISYLPQHTEIFDGTVRENIARMQNGDLLDVMAAARLVGIHDLIIQLPEGYDTVIGPSYPGLSGSQRKRIAIARAFYGRPRMIVMDEPTANLDRVSRRMLDAALAQRKAAGTSLVITQSLHSERSAAMADVTLFLSESKHEIRKGGGGGGGGGGEDQRGAVRPNRLRRIK